ncbi:MAG: class I SAM-dependent methyltransferase [Phycisphaeraceae bacterium]|nr:class I SAM-dependent methyltransferase [Phycisphaeraceae bacterium]
MRQTPTRRAASERAYLDADLYDAIHTPGTPAEVDGLERIAGRFVLNGRARGRQAVRRAGLTWLEPACGTGRYLRVLAKRTTAAPGRPPRSAGLVIGVDRERLMLDFAAKAIDAMPRAAADLVRLVRADIRRFTARQIKPGSVDVAFCLHNSIRHLQIEVDLLAHLRRVKRSLSARGVYAVGLELNGPGDEESDAWAAYPSEAVYAAQRGGRRYRQVFEYLPPSDASDPFETVITWAEVERGSGTSVVRREVGSTYRLRTWTPKEWAQIVSQSDLREIAVVDGHGDDLPSERRLYAVRVLARADSIQG